MDELKETALALQQEWGLTAPATLTEADLLDKLAERVMELVNEGPDAFYRLMYRLDIPERRLMDSTGHLDTAHRIARLIYDRQLQKIRAREYYKRTGDIPDADLKW